MGGGPSEKEHVLIALFEPEPKEIIAELKRRFPHFEITYVQVSFPKEKVVVGSETQGIDDGES